MLFTGLFGGLASSTALTLHFSRLGRHADTTLGGVLAAGILLACGTMFPRMLLIATMLNTGLFRPLLVPTLVMACVIYLPALWYWYSGTRQQTRVKAPLKTPSK